MNAATKEILKTSLAIAVVLVLVLGVRDNLPKQSFRVIK